MFSFQASDDVLIEEDQFQDLILVQQQGGHHVPAATTINNMVKSMRRSPKMLSASACNSIDGSSKRVLHREIERQRRQEMASLFTSLRNLLPLEYIKGKRSISDHTDTAVKYIKHLKNRISEMSGNRDELRKFLRSQENANYESSSALSDSGLPTIFSVTVRQCSGGVEILCSSSYGNQGLMTLSRMMRVISKEGLDVISCVSTKVDQRLLHTINTEVCDSTYVDILGLQQKLVTEVVS